MRCAERSGISLRFTARRRPVTLVFSEEHPTRGQAMARERQIKAWTRDKKEALISGDFGFLNQLLPTPSRDRKKR
jgi:predicted GIY-YIG superfamily endonuclease